MEALLAKLKELQVFHHGMNVLDYGAGYGFEKECRVRLAEVPQDKAAIAPGFDLAVFGKALGMSRDPVGILASCTGMVATVAYPYDDGTDAVSGEGNVQRYAARAYLEERFNKIIVEGTLCLWIPRER